MALEKARPNQSKSQKLKPKPEGEQGAGQSPKGGRVLMTIELELTKGEKVKEGEGSMPKSPSFLAELASKLTQK